MGRNHISVSSTVHIVNYKAKQVFNLNIYTVIKFCQHFITAFAPGDCGAPLWFERTDGAKIIAAVVEGFNIIGDEPEGTYPKLDYVTLVANAEILNFISNVDRILSPAKDGEEAILETDQD